jgi:hypothetical protein
VQADDALRLDYEQTTELMRTLTDIRFKLLAFVPTIAGAAVAFMGAHRNAAELLAVGLLGFFATIGVVLYDLRNSELYAAIAEHAGDIERKLGLGLAAARRKREVGLGFVYGAAMAGWTYLVVWGALRALDVGGARKIGALVGALVGLIVAAGIERFGRRAAT